jgi:hypothetical protein
MSIFYLCTNGTRGEVAADASTEALDAGADVPEPRRLQPKVAPHGAGAFGAKPPLAPEHASSALHGHGLHPESASSLRLAHLVTLDSEETPASHDEDGNVAEKRHSRHPSFVRGE